MSYRVKLLMCHYFQDDRAFTYAFIQSEFSVIQDLINHISKMFDIKDFSLLLHGFYLLPGEDIRIIQANDEILIKPNQVQQLPPARQVVESPAKKKKQKSKRKSADLDNCNEVKIKKRKLSSKFEPVATSSTRKKDIVESRVQYFNNLSNSNENSNIAEHDVGTEVVPEKLNNQLISHDLITPALSSKSTKKKKEKKLSEQMEISNEEKACELNNIKSNVPHQQLIHNDDSNAFKTPVDKMNNLSNNVHPKLIQHMTPLRNMLPTTVIKEKIHVIRNIVMSRDKDTILEENKCNNVSEVVTKKSADIVSVTTSDLNGNANSIGENSDSKNDEQVEEPQISKPDEQECLPSTSTIKNERVSLPVSTNTLTEVPEVQSNEIMDETPQRNSECKTISTAIPLKCSEKRLQSSMSYILSSLKSDCSSTSNSIDGNDCEEVKEKFITRRKRHRTRKNKPIHKDTPAPIKFSDFRRPNIQSKPLIHRFFAEEPIEIPSTDTEECNKIEQKSSDKPENVTILDLTEETPEIFENPLPVPLNGQKKSYLDTKLEICGQPLTQEFIDKLTVMSNVVPTRGDIIIFQMLKLGSSFTPEVTKNITGLVKSFDAETKRVEIDIWDGLSELSQIHEEFDETGETAILDWMSLVKPRRVA